VGNGTEYGLLENYEKSSGQKNFKLMSRLPKDDYDSMVGACDVGLIFLDHRFTIPNFPSRLLSYMQAKLPVLACTDPNTDIGKVIVDGEFGWWCESNNIEAFGQLVTVAINADTSRLGEIGYEYLQDNYTVERGYEIIQRRLK
jgi:glycosyltransferase involved in cell wall biosynthesis